MASCSHAGLLYVEFCAMKQRKTKCKNESAECTSNLYLYFIHGKLVSLSELMLYAPVNYNGHVGMLVTFYGTCFKFKDAVRENITTQENNESLDVWMVWLDWAGKFLSRV